MLSLRSALLVSITKWFTAFSSCEQYFVLNKTAFHYKCKFVWELKWITEWTSSYWKNKLLTANYCSTFFGGRGVNVIVGIDTNPTNQELFSLSDKSWAEYDIQNHSQCSYHPLQTTIINILLPVAHEDYFTQLKLDKIQHSSKLSPYNIHNV